MDNKPKHVFIMVLLSFFLMVFGIIMMLNFSYAFGGLSIVGLIMFGVAFMYNMRNVRMNFVARSAYNSSPQVQAVTLTTGASTGYPQTSPGYPQMGGYPLQKGVYPPQEAAYPPQQATYPPQQGSYLPQQGSYPPPSVASYQPPAQSQSYPPSGTVNEKSGYSQGNTLEMEPPPPSYDAAMTPPPLSYNAAMAPPPPLRRNGKPSQ